MGKKRGDVLIDNYTLQGAYGYLEEGRHGKLFEDCLYNLIECAVIYDNIVVPKDVLERNEACQNIAKNFNGIIKGKSLSQTPDLHHHIIDTKIVDKFRPILEKRNPFNKFDNSDGRYIETIGYPFLVSSPPGYMGRNEKSISFSERQTYYTYFCIQLASESNLNYVPSPIRLNLIKNEEFAQFNIFQNLGRDILQKFEKVRSEHSTEVKKLFKSVSFSLEIPLLLNFIKSKTKNDKDIIKETLKLRNSPNAEAFRKFCAELENSLDKGNLSFLDEKQEELEKLQNRWSKSLGNEKKKKKITASISAGIPNVVSGSISGQFNIPWPKIGGLDKKPHYVFLHELLSKK